MKVAVTVWNNRISPVFDVSRELMVAEVRDQKIAQVHYERMDPESGARTAERLAGMGVKVLICGAISRTPAAMLEAAGIQLIPFVTGQAENVVSAFAGGQPIIPEFLRCCQGGLEFRMNATDSGKGRGGKR